MRDYQILSAIMPVREVWWRRPFGPAKLLLAVLRSDIVLVWFAAGQAATAAFILSRILRKKIAVIAGGSEVSIEWHGSGIRSAIRFAVTRLILNNSDLVIAVSRFNEKEILRESTPKKLEVVYNGVNTNEFRPGGRKTLDILTVSAGRSRAQFVRKGLDRFAELARCLPHRRFVAVGELAAVEELTSCFPNNIQVTGAVSNSILLSYLQRARFYCQLSRHEQFGVSVAEAMAVECVPVVSDNGALPEIVGDCGIVVRDGDPVMASAAVEDYWNRCDGLGALARERVQALYSVDIRISRFKEIFSELLLDHFHR
jgi:glycosyltransferase involved in cell wall biosynthesis